MAQNVIIDDFRFLDSSAMLIGRLIIGFFGNIILLPIRTRTETSLSYARGAKMSAVTSIMFQRAQMLFLVCSIVFALLMLFVVDKILLLYVDTRLAERAATYCRLNIPIFFIQGYYIIVRTACFVHSYFYLPLIIQAALMPFFYPLFEFLIVDRDLGMEGGIIITTMYSLSTLIILEGFMNLYYTEY
jgi:hypothetical protein